MHASFRTLAGLGTQCYTAEHIGLRQLNSTSYKCCSFFNSPLPGKRQCDIWYTNQNWDHACEALWSTFFGNYWEMQLVIQCNREHTYWHVTGNRLAFVLYLCTVLYSQTQNALVSVQHQQSLSGKLDGCGLGHSYSAQNLWPIKYSAPVSNCLSYIALFTHGCHS